MVTFYYARFARGRFVMQGLRGDVLLCEVCVETFVTMMFEMFFYCDVCEGMLCFFDVYYKMFFSMLSLCFFLLLRNL